MKIAVNQKTKLIRKESNPSEDVKTALKANATLLDCLYRLSFTADKATAPQIDSLINGLTRKPNEIVVLLKRIEYVFKQAQKT